MTLDIQVSSLPLGVWAVIIILAMKYIKAKITAWKVNMINIPLQISYLSFHEQLSSIPTFGGSDGILTSYFDVFKRISTGDSRFIIQDGYRKVVVTPVTLCMQPKALIRTQAGNAFKIAELNRWHIIVNGADKINELRSAPDDVLSLIAASNEVSNP
jgi:hypothetical protein